jgi:hypothetical protein
MQVALELSLEVDVPDELSNGGDAVALKRWIWNEHSEKLFEATDVSVLPAFVDPDEAASDPPPSPAASTRRSVNHRLQMLDKLLSKVQRQYLQVEKVRSVRTRHLPTPPFSQCRSRRSPLYGLE